MEILATSARTMLDRAAFGVAQASPAGDWQFLNDRFREIVGHSRQEHLASSERDITDPDDRAESDGSGAGSWRMRFRLLIGEPLCPGRMEPSCGPNCVSL